MSVANIGTALRRRAPTLLLCIVFGLLITSCSDDKSVTSPAAPGAQGGSLSPRAAGAQATVLRLWSEIRSGSPSLTAEYDPKLRRLFGNDLILTVFDIPPSEYLAPPRVKEIRPVRSGVLVYVEGKGPGQKDPIRVSYLVAKVKRRWMVRYDSNLFNRIRGQVAAEVKLGLPRTKATEEKAAAAANRAVLAARTLFAVGPDRGTLPPR